MFVDKPPWVSHDGLSIFSIDTDRAGTRLVSGGSDSKVKVWSMGPLLDAKLEAKEGESKLLATLDQHASPVNVVRFSKDGKFIASGADDNVVLVCELKPGEGQASFGNSDRPNVENWRAVMHFRDHHNNIVDLAWSPDDSMIASCSLDNLIIVYDTKRGSKIASLSKHSSFVKGVCWDPIGRYLASQSDDKSVIIWSIESWEPVRTIKDPFVKCVGSTFHLRLDWSPHGLYLIAANAWKEPCHTAVVVDRSKSWDCSYNIVGHKSPVVTVRFNPKLFVRGSTGESQGYPVVALGSQDKIITVWLLSSPRPIAILKHFFESTAVDLSWSADGYTLFACSQDGTIAIFNFTDKELGGRLSDKEAEETLKNIYGETPSEMGTALPESADVLLLQDKKGGAKSPARGAPPLNPQRLTPAASPSLPKQVTQPQVNGNLSMPRSAQKETVQNDGRRRITPESIGPAGANIPVLGTAGRIGEPSSSGPVQQAQIQVAPSAAIAGPSTSKRDANAMKIARSPAKRRLAPGISSPQRARNEASLPATTSGHPAVAVDSHPALPRPVGQPLLTLVIARDKKAASLVSSEDAPLHVDAKSGVSGTEISCSKNSQTLWKDRLRSSVVAMAGNHRLVSVALEDGSLLFYTQAGRRVLPPIIVRGGVSFLGVRDTNVLVVSYSGSVQVFDMEKLRCSIETSLENLTVGTSQRSVVAVSLTLAGLPVVILDNNHAYVFETNLRSWMRVADNDYIGSVFNTTMSIPSGEEGNELAVLQTRASTLAGGSAFLSSVMSGGHGLQKVQESQITRRHLETLIGAAQVLNSPLEYKRWLVAYAEHLSAEGDDPALRELCLSLLGPPRPLSPAEKSAAETDGLQLQDGLGSWKAEILGLDKRRLLRDEVMKAIAQGGNAQGLLAEMLELLQEVEPST